MGNVSTVIESHGAMTLPTVGVDSYTYHRRFGVVRPGERPADRLWTVTDLVGEMARHDPDAVAYQTMFLPAPGSPEWPAAHEALLGGPPRMLSWGGNLGLDGGRRPDLLPDLARWCTVAAALGVGLVRIVVGGPATPGEMTYEERRRLLVPQLRRAAAAAHDRGVRLAVENHADLTARDLADLLDEVADGPGGQAVGAVVDAANLVRMGADPVAGARELAPYAVMAHLRDLVPSRRSADVPDRWPCRAPGEGETDLAGFVAALMAGGFAGLLAVELTELDDGQGDEGEAVARGIAWLRAAVADGRPAAAGEEIRA